jgi:hypothetical protein
MKKIGLFPFDPDVVLKKMDAPKSFAAYKAELAASLIVDDEQAEEEPALDSPPPSPAGFDIWAAGSDPTNNRSPVHPKGQIRNRQHPNKMHRNPYRV